MRKSGDKTKPPGKTLFQEEKENKIKAKEAKDLLTPKKAKEG